MENNTIVYNSSELKTTSHARDFFLHLGSMISLYAVCISFVNLLFRIINKSYPEVNKYYYWANSSEISFPVAVLIIVFPLFILISYLVNKSYNEDQNKKNLSVRKWLTYITLFIAGIIFTGDLIWILYKFLDGQDITWAFILKALTVLGVSGVVFGYYISEIRDHVTIKARRVYTYISVVLVIASIILGFAIIGSPKNQRLAREDEQTILSMQNMQWQIINYWQTNGMIGESLEEMNIKYSDNTSSIIYNKTGEINFELCASFNSNNQGNAPQYAPTSDNYNWFHPEGEYCFIRRIDTQIYPSHTR